MKDDKVLMVNTYDIIGGAALAGYAILDSLNKYSIFSAEILCGEKASHDRRVTQILSRKLRLAEKILDRMLVDPTISQSYFTLSQFNTLKYIKRTKPDIVNLHNIHGRFFAYPTIDPISHIAPIVVTMQDMWWITGHCVYSYDCEKWMADCSFCPHPEWYPKATWNTANFHWRRKKNIYQRAELTFVACSKWLSEEASKAPILSGKRVLHVYNPIDTDLMRPLDQSSCRDILGIPVDAKVLALAAQTLSDPRKGIYQLISTIPDELLDNKNLHLVVMGGGGNDIQRNITKKLPVHYQGPVDHPLMRTIVYNAADFFLLPTLADNFPNLLSESFSCGVPVIAFDVGGIGEAVQSLKTGYLAKKGDFTDFYNGVLLLLSEHTLREKMSVACRSFAVENLSMTTCAKAYEKIFNKVR